MSKHQTPARSDFLKNFPFSNIRDKQINVLNDISDAYNSDYKDIILEAPTGFGKSPVAIAVGMTLGSSYICTATKDLQTQYLRDFPYVKAAKGKKNFSCLVKEDLIRNGTHLCGSCVLNNKNECVHTTVEYGPCSTDRSFKGSGCKYRTFAEDYQIDKRGTKEEQMFLTPDATGYYQNEYLEWMHRKMLKDPKEWRPCQYFDQLNIARRSSHSVYNYPMFLSFLPVENALKPRELLVLDEGHLLEQEIVKFTGISISKRRWKRYISDFEIIDYGYDDIEKWIEFLIDLEAKMCQLAGDNGTPTHFKHRKEERDWQSKTSDQNKDDEEQEEYEDALIKRLNFSNELAHEAAQDLEKLRLTISKVLQSKKNWIVSEIKKENDEIVKVELKPLNISPYCKPTFDRCSRVLIMSATILNAGAFCRTVGLDQDKVKFIQVESDFPLENRPIIPLNIAYLNYSNLQSAQLQANIARTVDNIMSFHGNDKGIIHTTSYEQLNSIRNNISRINAQRLIETHPEVQRDQVIEQHINSVEPTVLISPSLHTGIDLKDDLSRFQIITKVPYPNLADRWTNAKRKADKEWYYWQTALKLIQAYGRSIRSKDDWAKTYVLDSGFISFVEGNASMFPNWFTRAIIKGDGRMYSAPLYANSKNIAIQTPQLQPVIITKFEKGGVLDYPDKEKPTHSYSLLNWLGSKESDKLAELNYSCYYCQDFQTNVKRDYEHHVITVHPRKPAYPCRADLNRQAIEAKGKEWEI